MDNSKLARRNPHCRDGTIKMDQSTHRYSVKGIDKAFVSVTTLISWYLPPVNPSRLADSLLASNDGSWRGMKKDELLRVWAEKGAEARHLGTLLHSEIELYYNIIDPDRRCETGRHVGRDSQLLTEWSQFLLFDHRYRPEPHRTEMMIYSPSYGVAGTVDFLARNSDGSVTLYDWKRSKAELGMEATEWNENGIGPLWTYPNTSFGRYSLQLNLYRTILEEEYGLVVKDMYVVRFHRRFASYELLNVLRSDHAALLLAHYRSSLLPA